MRRDFQLQQQKHLLQGRLFSEGVGSTEMLGAENEFGVIVENDEEALYKAVKKLIDDPQLLEYYKEKSLQRGRKFSTTETVNAVQNMLMRLVER